MQQIGELGGSARSAAKAKTSRENGRRGGRPKDKEAAWLAECRQAASCPLQPLKIPESRLLFICFADIRRGAAGRTDCCSRMAGL
jgi:hypothetical protein